MRDLRFFPLLVFEIKEITVILSHKVRILQEVAIVNPECVKKDVNFVNPDSHYLGELEVSSSSSPGVCGSGLWGGQVRKGSNLGDPTWMLLYTKDTY